MIDTSFGETYVRAQGPVEGPPLVLLPGDSENSLAWMPVIASLSRRHRCFAVDPIGDHGRSIHRRRPRSGADYTRWLDELFDGLGLSEVRLVAHSHGGWQAATYALAHPERLSRLVLLAPAATVLRPPKGLLLRAIVYQLVPARAVTKWYFRWYDPVAASDQRTRVAIDELVEHDLLARRCFKRKKFVRPRVLSDEEWRLLRVPTLFLVGDQEVTYSAHRAVERLAAVAPDVEAKVIPHADHHLTIVAPESLATAILMFLDDDRSPET